MRSIQGRSCSSCRILINAICWAGTCSGPPRADRLGATPRESSPAGPRCDVHATNFRRARQSPSCGDRTGDHHGSAHRCGLDRHLFRPDGPGVSRRATRLRQLHRALRRPAYEPDVARHDGRRRGIGGAGNAAGAGSVRDHMRGRRGRVHTGQLASARALLAAALPAAGVLRQADGSAGRPAAGRVARAAIDGMDGVARHDAAQRGGVRRLRPDAAAAAQDFRFRPGADARLPGVGFQGDPDCGAR